MFVENKIKINIKDIKKYPIKILQNNDVLFDGISDDVPDEISKNSIKSINLQFGILYINI